MQGPFDERVVITGGSAGLGLAMARALIGRGARVTALARDAEKLAAAARIGAATIAGDATDAALMNRVVADEQPDVLILNAGSHLPMGPTPFHASAAWASTFR
jgi:NADP-dependent 3-hydroxy acid dehydrogenase YdfG